MDRRSNAVQEYNSMHEEFCELEAALEESSPGIIKEYRQLYERKGGEQFRPDSAKVKCECQI